MLILNRVFLLVLCIPSSHRVQKEHRHRGGEMEKGGNLKHTFSVGTMRFVQKKTVL